MARQINIYMTPELKERTAAAAAAESLSLAAFIRHVLTLYLNEHGY